MKIIVAGQDRTGELLPELRERSAAFARAAEHRKPKLLPSDISARALAEAKSEAAYLNELIRLLRLREGVDTLPFSIPSRPGLRGWVMVQVKRALWRLLRYQHDRIAFRQNLINTMLTSALEFEVRQRQKEVAELQRR
ncbi:MAG: hypothetical protein HYV35_03200, partial [Lentisphaerae bacterium]|nr:hypothetical protein [Lentisphaerota bacterium]